MSQVLWEVTQGQLGKVPAMVTDTLPAAKEAEGAASAVDDPDELEEMQSRLQALRS